MLSLLAILVAGCNATLYPPTPVTVQGQDIHDLYNIVFIFAAVIFLVIEGAILYIVLRYRRTDGDDMLPEQTHGHTGTEILWTLIPFVIVAFLFWISWEALPRVQADPAQPAGVHVKVTAFQWCWKFEYRDAAGATYATVEVPARNSKGENCRDESGNPPTVVVPVGQRIRLQLHSVDVIHAFYVPQFLSKLDVVPQANEARDNIFDFTPIAVGEYRGQCAEFCGLEHNAMQLDVSVRSEADYQAWLTEQKSKPSPSPAASPPPGGGLQVVASTVVSFEQNQLAAPAGAPFVIHFENKQVGVPHNVWIRNAQGEDLFQGPDVQGPGSTDYHVGPLPAGTYTFYCHIHPNMTGTLEVQ
jgi:cytochrome c oxidase subunit 2